MERGSGAIPDVAVAPAKALQVDLPDANTPPAIASAREKHWV